MKKIFDISPLISPDLAVFPGDQAFSRHESMSFSQGHNLALSSLHTTTHIGAHTDAPSHYHPDGVSIDMLSLDPYLGPCQVVGVTGDHVRDNRIQVSILKKISPTLTRVLFKTLSYPNPNQWNADFWSLAPELVSALAERGVKLIGIDTPSVDPADDKQLVAHQTIYRHDLRILEGIVLTLVPEGGYDLIALPLRIKGADAAPVRAVLVGK